MLNTAVWTKLALSLFALGGAASGSYFLLGNNFLDGKSHPKILEQEDSTGQHLGAERGANSAGSSEQVLSSSQDSQGDAASNTIIANPHDGSGSSEGQSSLSVRDSSNPLSDETDQNSQEGLDKQEKDLDTVSTTSKAEKSDQVESSGGDLSSQSNEENVRGELQASSSIEPSQPTGQEPQVLTGGEYSARKQTSSFSLWSGKEKDPSLSAEYVIKSGIDSSDEKDFCGKLENGEEKSSGEEECRQIISNNLKEEKDKKVKLWVKSDEKSNVKKVLEIFDPYVVSLEEKISFELQFGRDSNKLSCEWKEISNPKKEVIVSCFEKSLLTQVVSPES